MIDGARVRPHTLNVVAKNTPAQLSESLSDADIALLLEVEAHPLRFPFSERFGVLRDHSLVTRGVACGLEITGRGQAVLALRFPEEDAA